MQIKRIPNFKLHGFNNLTKSLSFNMYDICYAQSEADRMAYIEYIDEEYNAERLTNILTEVSNIIGANILNIAKQDYEPQGASVTMLISEGKLTEHNLEIDCKGDCVINKEDVVAHLDKSHITVHTYPESDPDRGISTFRADIDVSTCGQISPLNALDFLLTNFFADIAIIDYRIRGFTRDVKGKKFFIDHKINSIQNYIDKRIGNRYQMIDVNVYQEKIFHTKMILKDFELDNYLFGVKEADITPNQRKRIRERLNKEMYEIFYGRNITKV